MTPENPLNEQHRSILKGMVLDLLSENERGVVDALGKAAHPLSMKELLRSVDCSYRTLKRVVRRLEKRKVVVCFRDAIKVVELNPVLRNV